MQSNRLIYHQFNEYFPNVAQEKQVCPIEIIRIHRNSIYSYLDIVSPKKINLNFQDDNG